MKIKIVILSIIALAIVATPTSLQARAKKKKYEKTEVSAPAPKQTEKTVTTIKVTDFPKHIGGEWNITHLKKKNLTMPSRASIYFDFNGNNLYGNTGCNEFNGKFSISTNELKISQIVKMEKPCSAGSNERSLLRSFEEVTAYRLTNQGGIDYLDLLSSKGSSLITLRRQNLSFIDGVWRVNSIDSINVTDHNLRLVIDTDQHSLLALTDCNLVTGYVMIDYQHGNGVQFENLITSQASCASIELQTSLFVALEETVACKQLNDGSVALLNKSGNPVITLTHIKLR